MNTTEDEMIVSIQRAMNAALETLEHEPPRPRWRRALFGDDVNLIVVQRVQMIEPFLLDVEVEVQANGLTAEQVFHRVVEGIRWPYTKTTRPRWLVNYRLVRKDAEG